MKTVLCLQGTKNCFVEYSDPHYAVIYYRDYKVNLVSGEKTKFSLKRFQQHLEKIQIDRDWNRPYVLHLFYEWGYYYQNLEYLIEADDILAIEIKYNKFKFFNQLPGECNENISLTEIGNLSFEDYQYSFNKVYEQLLEGNAYQVNLTKQLTYQLSSLSSFENLLGLLWNKKVNRGSFAHATYMPRLEKIILSNTPECLFSIIKKDSGLDVYSMPIKGSLPCESNQYFQVWEQLKKCLKNEGELNMITDLIRNDLSRIHFPYLAEIIARKRPLKVPKILHHYSVLKVRLPKSTTLGGILLALFPGGSVTGAPKKSAMRIIKEMEKMPRGIYCGATVVLHQSLLMGSLNIRTAFVDTKKRKLSYGSGGGLTLKSEVESEFKELILKLASFKEILTDT